MFIPRYWSEASHAERFPNRRQATLRRFGWSSTSQADADAHARRRVEEAVAVLRAGGPDALDDVVRRERAVAYNGADGLPIREEIVEEFEGADVVITRNGYGALCLNSTRALFVDVDELPSRIGGFGCVGALLGITAGAIASPTLLGWNVFLGALVGAVAFGLAASVLRWGRERADPHVRDPVRFAIERTTSWCASRSDWLVAVYRTPAGARLLALHAAFDAGAPTSFEFMTFVEADPTYQRMCRLQRCFRARVSPKPWRAGVKDHFRRGGTWPVRDAAKLAARTEWVRRYEQAARGFSSCQFVEAVGQGRPHSGVAAVQRIHDEMCRARSGLEMA